MSQLTNNSRGLLRSRINRHRDTLQVREYVEGTYGPLGRPKPNNLWTNELIEVAERFNVLIPTAKEGDDYIKLKMAGHAPDEAMALIEAPLRAQGLLANVALIGEAIVVAGGGGLEPDEIEDDAPEAEAAAEEPEPEYEVDLPKVEQDVTDIFAAMGRGEGVAGMVRSLALRANRIIPPPVTYDTSRTKGRVATLKGKRSMAQAGIAAPLVNATEKATRLEVYDDTSVPIDPKYVWPAQTAFILAAFADGKHVYAHGPRGSGKTEFFKQVAARFGREFIRISCDNQMEPMDLIGQKGLVDAQSVWEDGLLAQAIRKPGALILIDEISAPREGTLHVLHSVLDGDRQLTIPQTGERVAVAPHVLFAAGDNHNGRGDVTGQYDGTHMVNIATSDRFDVSVLFDYLPPLEEAQVLVSRTGCTLKLAEGVIRVATLTRAKAASAEISAPIGLRRLMALVTAINRGAGATYAYNNTVLSQANAEDVEKLRQCWEAEFNASSVGVAA